MAQKQIDPQKVSKIYDLFEGGSTIAEIVQNIGSNRETVRQYLLRRYTPKQKRAIVLRNFRQSKVQAGKASWRSKRELAGNMPVYNFGSAGQI